MHADDAAPAASSDEFPVDYLTVPLTAPDGQTVPCRLPLDSFWQAFRAAQKLELDEALDLITFGWKLLQAFLHAGITMPDRALAEVATRLADPLALTRPPAPVDAQTEQEALLAFSYKLLHEQLWSSEQAAAFAGRRLGQSINSEAWWTRVSEWASHRGLPPIT